MIDLEVEWLTKRAIERSKPALAKWHTELGVNDPEDTALHTQIRNPINNVFTCPVLTEHTCEALMSEAMKHTFTPNAQEDQLRQMPEVILRDVDFDWYEQMLHFANEYLNPMFESTIGRRVETGTIQICNYNPVDKQQGAYHFDASADISCTIPLNTGQYEGGGTDFWDYTEARHLPPQPTGTAVWWPSYNTMHRGCPVIKGDRYLLVFWLQSDPTERAQDRAWSGFSR